MTKRIPDRRDSGMTLLEVMCAISIGVVVTAAVATAFMTLNRVATVVTDFHSTRGAARYALEVMAGDIRQARSVIVEPPGGPDVMILDKGDAVREIRYAVAGNLLKRRNAGSDRVLAARVADFRAEPMNPEGKPVPVKEPARMVRVTLSFQDKGVKGCAASEFSVVTAMRNGGRK